MIYECNRCRSTFKTMIDQGEQYEMNHSPGGRLLPGIESKHCHGTFIRLPDHIMQKQWSFQWWLINRRFRSQQNEEVLSWQ